jgi:hypothetical protein
LAQADPVEDRTEQQQLAEQVQPRGEKEEQAELTPTAAADTTPSTAAAIRP